MNSVTILLKNRAPVKLKIDIFACFYIYWFIKRCIMAECFTNFKLRAATGRSCCLGIPDEIIIMKIKIFTLFIFAFSVNLYAEAFFAGGVSLINSDSCFNALRNPALMSNQSAENISFMYQYSYLLPSDAESDIKIGAVEGGADTSLNEDFNGVLYFSSVMHSGRSSYGIGISKNGEDQITFSSSDADSQLGAFTSHTTEEKKVYGVNFILSYSFKMNSKESIGLQMETSASYESTEKDEVTNTFETKNGVIEKTRVTTGGLIGYNLREENFEFGAIVKTGSYGFENQKYESTSSTLGYHENEVSNYYMHDDGLGIMLGLGLKISPGLRLLLEGGYIIPFSFEEKGWSDDTFVENTSEISVIYTALARSGVNYRYNRFVNFGFGGGVTTYKAKLSGDDSVQVGSSIVYIYQLTSGIDVKPSKDYTLLFGLSYKRTGIESEFKVTGTGFKISVEKNSVDAMCGVSCNF